MIGKKQLSQLLFQPKSIAVIGASSNPLKPGGRVFKNIKENGYRGELWPINPAAKGIMGLPAYSRIEELPSTPELALISIPATGVLDCLQALAKEGAKAVIILTAGFGEKGEEGKAAEKQFLELAEANEMTVIGPNCSGFLTPQYAGKFAGIIPRLKPGSIDFVSGSGATVDYVMEQANTRGLRFSHVLNLGNSIQLGVEDMLELLDESHGAESSKIVLLYLEAVNKPQKLLYHAKSLIAKGCVLIGIKSGVTEVGARAAASHTGAMTIADHAVQALFDKAGIIRVNSKQELIETTCALISLRGLPKGNRAGIVTDAGGPGVMLADELYRQGIELPSLSPRTIDRLKQVLPPQASLGNPIDCLPSRNAEQVREIFTILAEEEAQTIDLAFFLTGNSGMSDNWEIYQEIIRIGKTGPIPLLPIFSSATTCADLLEKVKATETIYFPDEVIAGQAVGRLVNRPRIMDQMPALANYDRAAISQALVSQQAALPPATVTEILKAAGFKLVPQIEVSEMQNLADACQTVGFPLVMKVIGPLHKSDAGGVRIGINTVSEARQIWQELITVPKATGVLIQKWVAGVEVILGATREPTFGHLILFGLGGIYTEILKDIQFALAPLSPGEALRMIQSIRSFPILKGIRGEKGVSVELLIDYLVRLGRLVHDFPEIREIDLNPVKGTGTGLYPVDCRILIDRKTD